MEVCIFLLFTVFYVSEGCILKNNQATRDITARSGESVLLPCSCTDLHTTPDTFTWSKYTNTWIIVRESDQYKNRVQLVNDLSPANLSLLLSHLTEDDAGDYRCTVKNGVYTYIRLIVEGCRLNDNGKTIEITAHKGESVLLPCSCTDLHTTPDTFTWRKHNTIRNTYEEISRESDQYRNRVQLFNDLSPANLSLLISPLTEEDAGLYRCTIKQSEYMYFRLTVKVATTTHKESNPAAEDRRASTTTSDTNDDSDSPPTNPYYFILAAVGGLLLLMILGGLIYWRYRAERRGQSCERKAGQRRDKVTQDCADGLYCTIPSEPTDTTEQKQDDVTYSAVVHFKPSTPATRAMDIEDNTEYASVKLN